MARTNTLLLLWDHCCQYVVDLRNRLARPLPQLHGRTPYEMMTGNTPDVSKYLEFTWYKPVWYYEPSVFPKENKILGYWIGVAHRIGQAMCYWLLPASTIPIACTTVQKVTKEELQTDVMEENIKALNTEIEIHLATQDALPQHLNHIERIY